MLNKKTNSNKEFSCIFPESNSSFHLAVDSCISQLEQANQLRNNTLTFTFFISSLHASDFTEKKQYIISRIKPSNLFQIPYSIVCQAPFGSEVVVETMSLASDAKVNRKITRGLQYIEIKYEQYSEIIGFGLCNDSNQDIEKQSREAFSKVSEILTAEGIAFDNVVRQWNYIENITCEFELNGCLNQNYQVFNNVRADYYNSCNWPNGYPAATGIGMQFGGVNIDFIAVKPLGNVGVKRIANPLQTDAHQYSSKVLVGMPMDAPVIATPKFERAKAVIAETIEVYVSGTAAIHGEQTLCHNIAEQTFDTIENINTLVSVQNLEAHGIFANGPLNCIELRVYLREGADADAVKKVMQQHFPTLPFIVVTGNVCRNNLWVEIEGVFCA